MSQTIEKKRVTFNNEVKYISPITIQELQTVKSNISQLLSNVKSYSGLYVDGMEYFCSISDMDNLFDIPLKELLTKISNDMRNGVEYDKSSSQFLFMTVLMELVLDNIGERNDQATSLKDVEEFFFKKREELNISYKKYEALIKDSLVNKDTLREIIILIGQLQNVKRVLINLVEKKAEESFAKELDDQIIELKYQIAELGENLKMLEKMEEHLTNFGQSKNTKACFVADNSSKTQTLSQDNSSEEGDNSVSTDTKMKIPCKLYRTFSPSLKKIINTIGISVVATQAGCRVQKLIKIFEQGPAPFEKGPFSDSVLSDVDVRKLREKFEVGKQSL